MNKSDERSHVIRSTRPLQFLFAQAADSAEGVEGNCAMVANRLAANIEPRADRDDLIVRIVHGFVAGQGELEGTTYWHAWVEVGTEGFMLAVDFSNGCRTTMPASGYRELGKAHSIVEYTVAEALEEMLQSGHHGPWAAIFNK